MLTANLDRRGDRPLSADAALRLYSCVDCRGCRSFCDHGNDVATVMMQARAELFAMGAAPARVVELCRVLKRDGAPPASSPLVPPKAASAKIGTWLFFGCQNEAADAGSAEATLRLVERRFGAAHVHAGKARCCGMPLWRLGDREGFAEHARAFAAEVSGAGRLVVDDPGCAYAMRELYPKVGAALPEVVLASSLLEPRDLERVDLSRHAPCDDEWEVRWLGEPSLRARVRGPLAKGSVLEGEAGSVGGMLLEHYEPVLAEKVAREAARDLLGGGAERIVTASPTCRRRLRAVGAPVDDLVGLWAASLGPRR